jgi:hypothetical protein
MSSFNAGYVALNHLKKQKAKVLVVHDSNCAQCCGECVDEVHDHGCQAKYGFHGGCPRNWQEHTHDVYFTPWGSESNLLYPNKTDGPSMFVDATKAWTGRLDAETFVAVVKKHFPNMQVTIIGDQAGGGQVLGDDEGKLPLHEYQRLLNNAWFYATGIKSSYELSLSDASTSGAIQVDVGGYSHAVVRPETTIVIQCADDRQFDLEFGDNYCEHPDEFESAEDEVVLRLKVAIAKFKTDNLAERTRDFAQRHHGPDYVGNNLLCAFASTLTGNSTSTTTEPVRDRSR